MAAIFLAALVLLQGWPFPARAKDADYDVIYGYQGGMAVFEKDEKQGAMDTRQQVIFPPMYDYISLFEYGLARVLVDKKWGMVRDTGEIVIEPAYDYISGFPAAESKSVACMIKDGKMGFVDSDGRMVSEPRFEIDTDYWYENFFNDSFYDRKIYVKENGLWGMLGMDGRMIIEPQYISPDAFPMEYGYTFVTDTAKTGGWTPDDITAKDFPVQGDTLEERIALLSAIYQNTKWYRVDASGNRTQQIKNLADLTIRPYFRKGVVWHDFQLEDKDFILIYMNPYGEVLRVLRNDQYEEEDPSGKFWAWDLWDMNW